MSTLIELELQMEIKALRSEIENLKAEGKQLRDIIIENGLESEIGVSRPLSPEEEICIKGIDAILELVRNNVQDKQDIINFDILHKNLRLIRGHKDEPKKKEKKADIKDLLKIVEGSNG